MRVARAAWYTHLVRHVGSSSGLAVGGVWGFSEGVRRVEGTSARLRMTTVVNGITRRGPFMANNLAVLGNDYCCTSWLCMCILQSEDDNQICESQLIIAGLFDYITRH